MAAWVWQGCHTLLICENLCNLWEAHLRQAVLCVLRILWEYSCSPTDFTLHRWLGCVGFPTEFTDLTELLAEKNLPRNSRNPQKLGCAIGCVGLTGMPYPPNLCASVPICGRHISARRFCVFRVFCGNTLSACLVGAAETAAPPAGYRSPSDRIPSAVQSDSVRRPIRFRPLSDDLV